MKKILISALILACFADTISSQNAFNCVSHEAFIKQMQTDPVFKKNQEQLEQETEAYLKNPSSAKSAAATYIIPVVFHVIYTTAYGNITDAQIIDQVAILNKEFPRQQADTALTPLPFKPFAAPFNVEFRLATIDPNGNCTNGINRVYSTLTNCSVNENDVKSVSYWPSNKYLNIWITQTMHYSGSTDCGGGGYASFPGGPATVDGINIRGDLISNIGTAATNPGWGNFKGRYLIHELGHWFNLRHIWGDAVCGNDQVADTPPAQNSNSGCPNFPRNPNNSCGSNANGEMFTDYMDYTNGPCLNMFTAGQVARMTAAITSNVSGRNNLWSVSNLNATGTSNPYTYPVACAAMPDVLSSTPIIACVDDSVQIISNSYGGQTTSRVWDFGGVPSSSLSDSIVKVKYSVPGVYSFTLTNNYLSSSKTAVFTNKVYILSSTTNSAFVIPFEDSFEDPNNFYNAWTIVNHDNDPAAWDLNTSTAYTGFNCIALSNFKNMAPTVDEIISPVYDMRAVENPTLTFKMSFARRTANDNDQLQVSISNDCGASWHSIYYKSANGSLKTSIPNQASSYTPAPTSSEWRLEKINLLPTYANGFVNFKFTFTGGGGNNIFLDDINLDGFVTVGVKKQESNGNIHLYPNPVNDKLAIGYNLKDKSGIEVEVFDVLGKQTGLDSETPLAGTDNTLNINTGKLKDGVYIIHVKQHKALIYTGKFIKQGSE